MATTPACPGWGCSFDWSGGGYAIIYAWATQSPRFHTLDFVSTTLTLTSTIVTIIDTVAGTKTTSTKFPSEYGVVPTNHDGTQVQTISYTRQGHTMVTTM